MESRMNKYYKEDISSFERTKKNQNLYKDVYNTTSDFDNLPIPDNSNVIDAEGLKNIISSRDEYRKTRDIEEIPQREKKKEEDRVYDINVMLQNAKSEINRKNDAANEGVAKSNFLTSLEEANIPNSDDASSVSDEISESHDKRSNTDSLPLDILVDLKGSDNTVVTDPIIKEEVTMIKKIKDGETFYSGSFNFSKKDFDDESDADDFYEDDSSSGLKIFFLIFGLLLMAAAIYLIVTKYIL